MFPLTCVYLFIILSLVIGAHADCQFWSGTAPFCSGSCGGCKTLATSNCGNGACCWTGRKALCQCCDGPRPCTPTQTSVACYGIVLVCKNEQLTLAPQGPVIKTCSTYACGFCFGFSFFLDGEMGSQERSSQERSCPDGLNVTYIDPMLSDVTVQGNVTLSEKEIESKLVEQFGPRLSPEQMKKVKIIRVLEPDLSVKGDDCK